MDAAQLADTSCILQRMQQPATGQLARYKVSGRSALGTKSYNFKVTYDAHDVAQHLLSAAQYVPNVVATAADAPDKWDAMAACKPGAWVSFIKGVLPRAPQRRAPLPALEAPRLGSSKR